MTWVLVELVEDVAYGEDGAHYYKSIGSEVYGPFDSKEAAEFAGKEINDARGYYTWAGKRRRCDLRDLEAFELVNPFETLEPDFEKPDFDTYCDVVGCGKLATECHGWEIYFCDPHYAGAVAAQKAGIRVEMAYIYVWTEL